MVKEVKYGVISDVHQDPRIVPVAIDILKRNGAEKLIVNGDIGDRQKTLKDSQNYVAVILDAVGKSGLESYVQPGSHETLFGYGPVIDYFSDKYENLIDTQRISHVEKNGHQLLFLPGSDFLCGGEYQIGSHPQIPSGRYIQTENGLLKFNELSQYAEAIHRQIAQGAMQYANMGDLANLVRNPESAIVVCHVPRKFDLENCVDVAHFGEVESGGFREYRVIDESGKEMSVIENAEMDHYKFLDSLKSRGLKIKDVNSVPEGSVLPSIDYSEKLMEMGAPVKVKRENRGNEDLRNLYEELGITKAVSGHFHESSHNANDSSGNHVDPGKKTPDLFWNSGHLDKGYTGILTVNGSEVSYENILLQDYIKGL